MVSDIFLVPLSPFEEWEGKVWNFQQFCNIPHQPWRKKERKKDREREREYDENVLLKNCFKIREIHIWLSPERHRERESWRERVDIILCFRTREINIWLYME